MTHVARRVAALHQDRARSEAKERRAPFLHFLEATDRTPTEQPGGLGKVGSEYRRDRDQLLDERRNRVLAQKGVTGLRDHHRVQHHRLAEARELAGHDPNGRGRPSMPTLTRPHREVLEHRADLGGDRARADSSTAVTDTVFWAVTAVMTLVP